jgi:membrane protein DedA with SNARE-associated domain
LADWVIHFIEQHGYGGIALLMLAENIFPPLPSELIMPFAAFQSARGQLHWVLVILAGTIGSIVGTLPWYFAGRLLGLQRVLQFADRHGRWLTLSRSDIESAERWFGERGSLVLVFGRLVPALRTVISLPAGISRMPLWRYCLWTGAGSLIWCSILTAAGTLLASEYQRIARIMSPVSTAILVGLLAWYVWRLVQFKPAAAHAAQRDG